MIPVLCGYENKLEINVKLLLLRCSYEPQFRAPYLVEICLWLAHSCLFMAARLRLPNVCLFISAGCLLVCVYKPVVAFRCLFIPVWQLQTVCQLGLEDVCFFVATGCLTLWGWQMSAYLLLAYVCLLLTGRFLFICGWQMSADRSWLPPLESLMAYLGRATATNIRSVGRGELSKWKVIQRVRVISSFLWF